MRNRSEGQSLIEILIAVAIIVILAVAITGLAALSTRILIQSERKVVALGIANEKLEKVRSGQREGPGIFISGTEILTRNNLPFTVTTTGGGETRVTVEWPAPGGATRKVEAVTYVTQGSYPLSCDACSSDTTCDQTLGICRPKLQSPAVDESFSNFCQTGLLCPDGSICNVNRKCGLDPIDDVDDQTNCRPGEDCGGGALCPLSGICPTVSCSDGGGCSGGTCFNGFCYDQDWFGLTFPATDTTGPMSSSPLICSGGSCGACNTCKVGSGPSTVYYIQYCTKGWIPQCGGSEGCQGGYAADGSCPVSRSLTKGQCAGTPLSNNRTLCTGDQKECQASELSCPWPYDADGPITDGSVTKEASVYWGGFGDAGCESYPVHNVAGPTNSSGQVIDPTTGAPIPDCSSGGSGGVGGIAITMEQLGGGQPPADGIYHLRERNTTEGKKKVKFKIRPLVANVLDRVDVNVELIKGDMGNMVVGQDARIVSCNGDACLPNPTLKRQVLRWEPGVSPEVHIEVEITNDDSPEQHEDFKLAIARARSNYYEGVIKPASKQFIIYNDDISLVTSGVSGLEQEALANGGTVTHDVVVTKLGATSGAPDPSIIAPANIDLTPSLQHLDTDGSDVGLGPSSLPSPVFPATSDLLQEISIPVEFYDDLVFETIENEEFRIALLNISPLPAGYKLTPNPVPAINGSITDNELGVGFSSSGGSEPGGPGNDIRFSAYISRGVPNTTSGEVCVNYGTSNYPVGPGNADGGDYSCGGGSLCFLPSDGVTTSASGTCAVADDSCLEGSENFSVTVTSVSGAEWDGGNPLPYEYSESISDDADSLICPP